MARKREPVTSLKVKAADKRRFDRLQEDLSARRGRKVTQQDLFSEILSMAMREKEQLEQWRPLNKKELSRLFEIPIHTEDRRGEKHIDEDLYGDGP